MSENKSDLIPATGLWIDNKEGNGVVAAGTWGGVRVAVMVNRWKENDRQPDYNLCFSKPKKRNTEETQEPQVQHDEISNEVPF